MLSKSSGILEEASSGETLTQTLTHRSIRVTKLAAIRAIITGRRPRVLLGILVFCVCFITSLRLGNDTEGRVSPIFRGRRKQPPLSQQERLAILQSSPSSHLVPPFEVQPNTSTSTTSSPLSSPHPQHEDVGICIVLRSPPGSGIVLTSNADRVRTLSALAASHLGGYKLLPHQSIWNSSTQKNAAPTKLSSGTLPFTGRGGGLSSSSTLGEVLSRRREEDRCQWVVFVGVQVMMVPTAAVSKFMDSLWFVSTQPSMKGGAGGGGSDDVRRVVAFHTPMSSKAIDSRVLLFSTATPTSSSSSYLRNILSSRDDGEVEMHLQASMKALEEEKESSAAAAPDILVRNILSVLKVSNSVEGATTTSTSQYLPFEVASIPRSPETCKLLEKGIFATFTPNASQMPVPCAIPSSPIVSVLSASQCWYSSCEHSETLYIPQSPDATVCVISSKGTGKKGAYLRPMNVLSWDYYTAHHSYKMLSYDPRGKDSYMYDRHRTKLNALLITLQDPDCAWVMWSDDDTIVVNFEITLESIIAEFAPTPVTSVIGAWDQYSDVVNSGNFFIRRSLDGARFAIRFRKWLYLGFVAPRRWADNTDFIHLIETPEFSTITVIAPQERFNAYITTYVADPQRFSFDAQTSLLVHYPGKVPDIRWRAIPTCALLQNTEANEVLGQRVYKFCEGLPNVAECFTHHCRKYSFTELVLPEIAKAHPLCVIQPPSRCGSNFLLPTTSDNNSIHRPSCRVVEGGAGGGGGEGSDNRGNGSSVPFLRPPPPPSTTTTTVYMKAPNTCGVVGEEERRGGGGGAGCKLIHLAESTPCSGPLSIPTAQMSELTRSCLWTIMAIPEVQQQQQHEDENGKKASSVVNDGRAGEGQHSLPSPSSQRRNHRRFSSPCLFNLQIISSHLTLNPASIVMGVEEQEEEEESKEETVKIEENISTTTATTKRKKSGVVSGFIAIKGNTWGDTFVKHIGLFHTLQLTVPPLGDYYRDVMYHIATSRQFMAVLDKVVV